MPANKKIVLIFLTSIALLMFQACTKNDSGKNSPLGSLAEYVKVAFSVTSVADKEKLLALTTGEVRGILERMTDEDFKSQFVLKKRTFHNLKVKDQKKISEDKTSITYEVSFVSKNGDASDQVIIKKLALLSKTGDSWKIAEVRSLKTYIEHQNELSF